MFKKFHNVTFCLLFVFCFTVISQSPVILPVKEAEAGLYKAVTGKKFKDTKLGKAMGVGTGSKKNKGGSSNNNNGGSSYNIGWETSKYGYYPNGNYPTSVPAEYRVSVDGLLGPETREKMADYPQLAAQFGVNSKTPGCTNGSSNCGSARDNVRAFQLAYNNFVEDDFKDDVAKPGPKPGKDSCTQVTRYTQSSTGQCEGAWGPWQSDSVTEERRVKNGNQRTTTQVWELSYKRNAKNCPLRTGVPPVPGGAQSVDYQTVLNTCQEIEFRPVTIGFDILGCMDPNANNYDTNANIDDGSCDYGFTVTDPDPDPDPTDSNIPPYIVLAGQNNITLVEGATYTEPGYQGLDAEDGDITGDVVVTGTVDTSVLGQNILRYNVQDSDGADATEVLRRINIIEQIITCTTGQILNPSTNTCSVVSCPVGYSLVGGVCEINEVATGSATGTALLECSLDQDWNDTDNSCDQNFRLARTNQPIYFNVNYDLNPGCLIDSQTWSLSTTGNTNPEFELESSTINDTRTEMSISNKGNVTSKQHTREITLNPTGGLNCAITPITQELDITLLNIQIVEE